MHPVSGPNYYELLGLSEGASDSEIRLAYKKSVIKWHPDKATINNLTQEKATETFKLISIANETLSNPLTRKVYDMTIRGRRHESSSASSDSDLFNRTFHVPRQTQGYDRESIHAYNLRFPEQLDKETSSVIDRDDCNLLDQFVKGKDLAPSFLNTILYNACKRGKLNISRYLIEVRKLDAHVYVEDDFFTGRVFEAAAESGNVDLVKYLHEVQHIEIESVDLKGDTALSKAASKGHVEVVGYLISKGANLNPRDSYLGIFGRDFKDILKGAINSKKLSIVTLLVEAGTEISDSCLGRALELGTLDIVYYLLQKRPGLKTYQYNESPACLAVKSGNVALVKYLEEKENLNIFEKYNSWDDNVALLTEAGAQTGSIEMMTFLLEEKGLGEMVFANLKYIEAILRKAFAVYHASLTKIQIQERIHFLQFLMEEKHIILPKDMLESLITENASCAGLEINSYLQSFLTDSPRFKKMLYAVATQGIESLSLVDLFKVHNSIIKRKGGARTFQDDVHEHIKNRNVSLDELREALHGDKQSMAEALFYYSNNYCKNDLSPLKLLLELGVDLNAENAEGVAGIHVALQSGGYNEIVQFYIDNGADLSKKNKHGRTAAEILGL